MSRSCHRATSSRPAAEVAAQHPGQAAQALGEDRVALVGHGRAALLARLRTAPRPRPPRCGPGGGSRCAISSMVAPTAAQAQRYSAWRSRAMTWVAGTGVRPRARAHVGLDRGVDVGVRAHRAGQLAHRDRARGRRAGGCRSRSACRAHRANLAPKVVGSACMPWVRPVTGTSMQLEGPGLEAPTTRRRGRLEQQVGGPGQGGAQRGVDHVRGGEPVVDPRARRARRCAPGPRRRRRPRRGR